MGNFRNGELATRCIRGSVDFGDLTLHYGQPLGPAISRREVKGSLPQSSWPGVLNGFELLVGIQAGGKFQWSQVSRLRSTTIRSEDLVSLRSAISRRPISAHRCCNGEQKAGRSTPNHLKNARLATEAVASSPLRKLPIRQELYEIWLCAHFSQRETCPPRAAVRQLSIADDGRRTQYVCKCCVANAARGAGQLWAQSGLWPKH